MPERRLVTATGDVHIAAEAPDAIHLQGVVEFPVLVQGRALRLRQGVEDQPARGFGVQQEILQWNEISPDPCGGGRPS